MTGQGAPSRAPACRYTWAGDHRRTCDEPATTILTITSPIVEATVRVCDKHARALTKKYGGINPSQVTKAEAIDAAPTITTII